MTSQAKRRWPGIWVCCDGGGQSGGFRTGTLFVLAWHSALWQILQAWCRPASQAASADSAHSLLQASQACRSYHKQDVIVLTLPKYTVISYSNICQSALKHRLGAVTWSGLNCEPLICLMPASEKWPEQTKWFNLTMSCLCTFNFEKHYRLTFSSSRSQFSKSFLKPIFPFEDLLRPWRLWECPYVSCSVSASVICCC